MKQMQASVFKSQCLKVMDRVQATGEPVVVTKRGKPMVKIIPAESRRDDLFGFMKGRMEIVGDIESPVVPLSNWSTLKKHSSKRRFPFVSEGRG